MERDNWKPGNMIYPVPVVMVCSQREGEKPNIITVAWTGTICTNPAMAYISVRKERYSYDIISETKEFVINLVTKDLVKACDFCGVKSGRDIDKFKSCNLTPVESKYVKCPSILESPVCIECKVLKTLDLGSHTMFIANVLGVSILNKYMDDTNKFCLNQSGLVTYSHGEYFTLGDSLGKFGFSVKK